MKILDPRTGTCEIIDITQRLANRKATIKSMAAPVGYTAELVDLGGALERECQKNKARIDKAIEDIKHSIAFAKSGEMKPCDSE
jgi:hypothetical protein